MNEEIVKHDAVKIVVGKLQKRILNDYMYNLS